MWAWSLSLLKIQNVFPIFFLHLHGNQDFASQTIGRDDNILMMSSKFGKVFKNENMKGLACFLEIWHFDTADGSSLVFLKIGWRLFCFV